MDREVSRSQFSGAGFVVSAVLLGALVLAALFVVVGAAHPNPTDSAATPYRAAARAVAPRSTPMACSLPAGSQQAPTVGPALSWVTVGAMQAPRAPGRFGPQHESDGVGVCFARNPTGALLAAINFFAQATVTSAVRLFEALAANTAGRRLAVAQARDGQDQLLQDSDGDPGSVQVTGYQVVDYTPEQTNLNVVLEGPGGELAAVESQLDWQAGDWKFVIPSGGQLNATPVTTMDGFVSWTAGGES